MQSPFRREQFAMHVRLAILLAALALPVSAQMPAASSNATSRPSAIHNIFWQPNQLHQGSPIFLTVELERPATRVTGTFVNKRLTFFSDSTNKKTWHALAGIDLETPRETTASS
jgi:hypothetical protein